jgi:pimeloyl-ACP methyl ester carboxylesterase
MVARFLKSGPGIFLLTLVVLVAGAGSMVGYQIHELTHPPRVNDPVNPGDLLLRADEVSFQSTDGIQLTAWLIHGDRDAPAIILCHDLGESKAAFLDAAVPLQRSGYNLLIPDFRGHGKSGGTGSSLGTLERYDVLGAIDFLRTRRDLEADRIGIWGIGMGAYAGLLAAAERQEVVALALDSPYPDVASYLDIALFRGLPPSTTKVTSYASVFYAPYFQWSITRNAAAQVLPGLTDRNFLFIVATSRPGSAEASKAMYAALPDSGSADKNLLALQGSGASNLYDEDRRRYSEAITTFFGTYLKTHLDPVPEAIKIQVK